VTESDEEIIADVILSLFLISTCMVDENYVSSVKISKEVN